jgi:hypothetical protein
VWVAVITLAEVPPVVRLFLSWFGTHSSPNGWPPDFPHFKFEWYVDVRRSETT